ncbi:hypothetical protein KIN20_030721 [Parelaphostrongylus tenuis]|uniref:Uncharacterized protein n=1 Tax=Parelaphostrongylus tenuis TaxID=148309 RepID=A0AAD5R5N2_PARTN|nr:hypothetical protein KIN20_030721 [Parelaphostrongylus tenuis]
MAICTGVAARAQIPELSPNSGLAEAFVKRLIIQELSLKFSKSEVWQLLWRSAFQANPMPTFEAPCLLRFATSSCSSLNDDVRGLIRLSFPQSEVVQKITIHAVEFLKWASVEV